MQITRSRGSVFLCAVAVLAWTQPNGFAQTIDRFVVTGEAAERALSKSEISGETAAKVAQAFFATPGRALPVVCTPVVCTPVCALTICVASVRSAAATADWDDGHVRCRLLNAWE